MRKRSKLFIATLALAGIFMACSNDKALENMNNSAREISFSTQGGMPTTRVAATTADQIDAFLVWGGETTQSWGTNGLLFNGQTVFRTLSNSFDYFPKKYHPNVGNYDQYYVAFSPVSAFTGGGRTPNTNIFVVEDFIVHCPSIGTDGKTTQVDILIAVYEENQGATPKPIEFNFVHALSRVYVSAINETADPVFIKNITYKNMYQKAHLTYARGTAGPVWNNLNDIFNYSYLLSQSVGVPAGSTTEVYTVVAPDQGMLLIPQTLNTIEVKYILGGEEFTATYNAGGINLLLNHQYNFLIKFVDDRHAIEFEVIDVSDFQNNNVNTIQRTPAP